MNLKLLVETTILCLIAATSPGPNFCMTISNTMKYGKIQGLMTAIGIGFGVTIWLFLCGFGLSYLLEKYKFFSIYLNISLALMMFYLAYKIITPERNKKTKEINLDNKSKLLFFKYGFIGTILNAGVGMFYSVIFAKIINYNVENYELLLYGLIFNIIEFCWYIFVVIFFTFANNYVKKYNKQINFALCASMIYFSCTIMYDVIILILK